MIGAPAAHANDTIGPHQSPVGTTLGVAVKRPVAILFAPLLSICLLAAGAAPCAARHGDALAIAAQAGDAQRVRTLLDAGADPNDYGNTYSALMHAAGNGHVEAVRLLLARGARVDHRDHNGDRALLWAAQRGHVEVVRL